jgi:hypothetical protein
MNIPLFQIMSREHGGRISHAQNRLLHAVDDRIRRHHARRRRHAHHAPGRQPPLDLDRLPSPLRRRPGAGHAAGQRGRADGPVAQGRPHRRLADVFLPVLGGALMVSVANNVFDN